MKPLPRNPMAQHSAFMAAFCEDLLAGDANAPRANRIAEIARQTNTKEHS